MRHSFRVTIVLLAAALVVLVAGCGGGKKVIVVVTHPATTGATGGTGATGAGPTGSTGTTTASGASGFASAKNCLAFAGVGAKIASAMASATGASSSDPKTVENEFQALADAAPSEVKGDFQTLADAFSGYMTALSNSGYKLGSTTAPTAAQLAALVQAAKAFNTSKLKAAEKNLQAWAKANCQAP